jgi:hypothetical protein
MGMMRLVAVVAFATALAMACHDAWAAPSNAPKVTPYGVEFPLITPVPYSSSRGDPYQQRFGVNRWLNPRKPVETYDAEEALVEAYEWFGNYGGYGVIGHGEDVFTGRAAQFRRLHRGR